jgi:iron-sulfur cluster repair protein YtfE (RIC family)
MKRLDVYTAVHKMQRARLFELTVEAGKSDPADKAGAARLAAAVDTLVDELVAHAEHEERFIHPLLRAQALRLADALEVAHVELDARLDQLRHVATHASDTDDPNLLYRALAAFTAAYLEHLAIEEDQALPALWEGCSDDELMGILVSFMGSRSDTENLTSLLAQLPTLNPLEINHMVAVGLPGSAREVAELLATVLNPLQLGTLRASLSGRGGDGLKRPSPTRLSPRAPAVN